MTPERKARLDAAEAFGRQMAKETEAVMERQLEMTRSSFPDDPDAQERIAQLMESYLQPVWTRDDGRRRASRLRLATVDGVPAARTAD